ncbi:MAG: hypothetical protein LBK75_03750 [Oscillospiraceae bacterium]|jgi:hypothetical protein|nr:hypothetical protein [Oscillospiraceae bacterium]
MLSFGRKAGRRAARPHKTAFVIAFLTVVSLTLSVLPTTAVAAPTFTVPIPIPNAAVDTYDWFFNFRLLNFAPETDPLVKEALGDTLVFDPDGFWDYSSFYSHAVGFAFNLPVVAYVEYGQTTSYGARTPQSESYYYNHLFYLTDLTPGTQYHYRIHAMGTDGSVITSEDRVVSTKVLTPDIIRIPQDMPGPAPYVLDQTGKTYLLTQDITVPNLAVNIKANDVTLDLGGHTIVYDEAPPEVVGVWWNEYAYNERATFGIRAGLWNYLNTHIYNGTVKQGANGGKGYIGIGFGPVFLGHMGSGTQNEVAGVTADYYGDDVSGMVTGEGSTHHNVVYDRGKVISDRHAGLSAIAGSGDVAYNSLRRFRHRGLDSRGYVHGNELYSDSYDTNSFALSSGDDSRLQGNKVFGMGYHPVGVGWGSNSVYENNLVYIHATAPTMRSSEYGRLSGVAGFRYSNTIGTVSDSLYRDNTVILKLHDGCGSARGIWVTSGIGESGGFVFQNNTVKVESLSENLDYTNVDTTYTCVDLNGEGYNIDLPEAEHRAHNPILFEHNTLIGNVHLITFGSGYGVGSNGWFYDTTFEKIESVSQHFEPVRIGFWYYHSLGNKIINWHEGPGVNLADSVVLFGSTGHMEVSFGVKPSAPFKDTTGHSIANRSVHIEVDGDEPYSLDVDTDGAGLAHFELISTIHDKNNLIPTRKDYGPVTFTSAGYLPKTMSFDELRQIDSIVLTPVGSLLTPPDWFSGQSWGTDAVLLSWWTGQNIDGTKIWRADTPSGSYTLVGTADAYNFVDTSVQPGVTYYYKLSHYRGGLGGQFSDVVALASLAQFTPPDWFSGQSWGTDAVLLSWWTGQNIDGTKIWRADTSSGPYTLVGTADAYNFVDTSVQPGVTYYYKLSHYRGSLDGQFSDVVALASLAQFTSPDWFSGQSWGADAVLLSWWTGQNIDGTKIWRADTPSGPYTLVGTADAYNFADTSIQPGVTYYYKLSHYRGNLGGQFSDVVALASAP